ncbi:phosphoribosylanthranilate isomerase [uncultured Methanobrevibacter sp.]|uniref:phosphoribosylanthranilate isomerase n=1 Tax=uncultured Methanobrevibacter sp. TaxID=253161 RepID=UPI0025D76B89|nr:phosphoribosylanthranilate isomerase [uncultured Methanobrevibacter sp.]
MVKVKICGLKRAEDIEIINKYNVDYGGFVFAKSSRQINAKKAEKLSNLLKDNISPVGVFVDEDINFILELFNANIIKIAQLHGKEDEEYIKKLKEKSHNKTNKQIPIINSIEIKDEDINKVNEKILNLNNSLSDYILLDSGKGSGKCFNWNLVNKNNIIKKPFFLAGGLNSNNIKLAIDEFNPYSVDLSSSVEKNGFKDEEKIKEIVEIVKNNIS